MRRCPLSQTAPPRRTSLLLTSPNNPNHPCLSLRLDVAKLAKPHSWQFACWALSLPEAGQAGGWCEVGPVGKRAFSPQSLAAAPTSRLVPQAALVGLRKQLPGLTCLWGELSPGGAGASGRLESPSLSSLHLGFTICKVGAPILSLCLRGSEGLFLLKPSLPTPTFLPGWHPAPCSVSGWLIQVLMGAEGCRGGAQA